MIIHNKAITALLMSILFHEGSAMQHSSSISWGNINTRQSHKNNNSIGWGISKNATSKKKNILLQIRGGQEASTSSTTSASTDDTAKEEEESLEDKVRAAMLRLGLSPDDGDGDGDRIVDVDNDESQTPPDGVVCEDGVCTVPGTDEEQVEQVEVSAEDFETLAKKIANDMTNDSSTSSSSATVDMSIIIAALGATRRVDNGALDEVAAREMIQNEIDAIGRVTEDCDEVQQLVSEGHELSLSRRALAFADMNVEVARAILQADEEDAQQEEEEQMAAQRAIQEEEEKEREETRRKREVAQAAKEKKEAEAQMKTVKVDANFDPTNPTGTATSSSPPPPGLGLGASTSTATQARKPDGAPPPAKKTDVVFQATSANIQKLVLESPVPVLLDVYADWCGPCKALTPALEEMAIKAGGMFRLVKLNTDEERTISSGALEVQSLPTIFGIKDGKIVHSFKGMPRSEDFMRNFLMGLFGAGEFNPRVTEEEQEKYEELSKKLIKVAGASGFTFSQRERLNEKTTSRLDALVKVRDGNMADAEESAKTLRSLLNNVIRDPYGLKFRRINLENKVIKARIANFAPALSILKSVGFANDEDGTLKNTLILGKGKKFVSSAPLTVAKEAIDKWIDKNRREIATATRKKRDEIARAKLLEEAEEVFEEDDETEQEEEEVDEATRNLCNLKLRIEGKKKVHDVGIQADEPLSSIIDSLPVKVPEDEEVQITCAARRMIVKSTDSEAMNKTLREHRLFPAASVVIKIGKKKDATASSSSSSMKERAAARKAMKKGEHTMQSVGIYSKDDNAKGELIDGGGGVWYEQDVTSDDEAEGEDVVAEILEKEESKESTSEKENVEEEESASEEEDEYDEYDGYDSEDE